MKSATILIAAAGALAIFAGIYMIDIDQTQETVLPEITVEGGQLPEFDADVGEVEVTEETVTVPNLEINPPRDDG